MNSQSASDLGMHLSNAAQIFYNMSSNVDGSNFGTLSENIDFDRRGGDIVFKWHDMGQDKEVSMNDVWEYINGGSMDRVNQLLDTVSNLEERLEAMEFYNNDEPQSA